MEEPLSHFITLSPLSPIFTTLSIKPLLMRILLKTGDKGDKVINPTIIKKQCISFYYLFMFAVIETVVIVIITNHFILSERTTQKTACNITTF